MVKYICKVYLNDTSNNIITKRRRKYIRYDAAPGGKTTQIAALSNNQCFITACEKNKIR